ncbi:HNH endonuclease [Rhodococcus sp. NPDC004095]
MGADRAHVVDHINRDTLDCVRSNMRLATVQQNCFNRSTASNSTKAGARAIYKNATGYSVRLSSFGVLYHVKYFDSESAAIQSRDELAKALFGEFSPYV